MCKRFHVELEIRIYIAVDLIEITLINLNLLFVFSYFKSILFPLYIRQLLIIISLSTI